MIYRTPCFIIIKNFKVATAELNQAGVFEPGTHEAEWDQRPRRCWGEEADGWGNWALDLCSPTQEALGLGSGAPPHLAFVSEHLYAELTDHTCTPSQGGPQSRGLGRGDRLL